MKLYFMKKEIAIDDSLTGIKEVRLDDKLRIYLPAEYRKDIEKIDNSKTYYTYKAKSIDEGIIIIPKITLDVGAISRLQFPFFDKSKLDADNRLTMPKIFEGQKDLYIYGCGDFMFAHPQKDINVDEFIELNYVNEMK